MFARTRFAPRSGPGVIVLAMSATSLAAQQPSVPIVPAPAQVTMGTGTFPVSDLELMGDPSLPAMDALTSFASRMLEEVVGTPVPVAREGRATRAVRLVIDSASGMMPEGYELTVEPGGVVVRAADPAGVFYGVQSLVQLIAAAKRRGATALDALEIRDEPRFPYRGMHLDVGRHFFPVAFIKRYIDLLATFKMNRFHWHLTEDQGWRIEIESLPRLTEVGAWRRETIVEKNFDPYIGDGERYGGYYTQQEIREVVAYAAERYVTIIPEIEMPGHSMAALAAYPELACTSGPFEVGTRWGIYEDIYCPKEETFTFLENVLRQVMELFPSTYIHIGGDEAPKARWEESPFAQDVMRREGLADEHELQSYFIRRIEQFLSEHGRRLIGWDEILEGGLPPEATVMSWRGMEGGIEAAKEGHDVIMTPTSHVYFDYYQGDPSQEPLAIGGFTPLEQVYAFEPVPGELSLDEARHVLGAQGNVWTEYMKTPDYVEYMVFPRLLALAEVVWSPKERRNWDDFFARLGDALAFLDRFEVNYRIPDVGGLERDELTLDGTVTVRLHTPLSEAEIRYSLDGSTPDHDSELYRAPLELDVTTDGTVVNARVVLPGGKMGAVRSARFRHATLRPATAISTERMRAGIRYRYYEESVAFVEQLQPALPVTRGVTDAIGLMGFERPERFGLVFDGFLSVPADGIYELVLWSDDGSRLWIGDELVVNHDGLHGMSERSGLAALARGFHPIRVSYFQAGGGRGLEAVIRDQSGDGAELRLQLVHQR